MDLKEVIHFAKFRCKNRIDLKSYKQKVAFVKRKFSTLIYKNKNQKEVLFAWNNLIYNTFAS